MRASHIIFASVALAIATHVAAEPTSASFYIVQDDVTKRCAVVDVKPTPDGIVTTTYENRALAEAALAEAARYEIPDCGIKQ